MTTETPKQYAVRCIRDHITQARAKGEDCSRLEQALELVKAGMDDGDMPHFKVRVARDEFSLMIELNTMLSKLVDNTDLEPRQVARALRYVADTWSKS